MIGILKVIGGHWSVEYTTDTQNVYDLLIHPLTVLPDDVYEGMEVEFEKVDLSIESSNLEQYTQSDCVAKLIEPIGDKNKITFKENIKISQEKLKEKTNDISDIAKLARDAYKTVVPGDAGNEETDFILAFVMGYTKCQENIS